MFISSSSPSPPRPSPHTPAQPLLHVLMTAAGMYLNGSFAVLYYTVPNCTLQNCTVPNCAVLSAVYRTVRYHDRVLLVIHLRLDSNIADSHRASDKTVRWATNESHTLQDSQQSAGPGGGPQPCLCPHLLPPGLHG